MTKYLLFIATLAWAFIASDDLYGQMVGGSTYLKGNYLEVGIAPNGSLGGASPVPAGYHPGPSLTTIGARFDAGKDGWTTGTPPAFGEFTMLGSPFEGWSIQANAVRYDAYYTMGAGIGTNFSPGLTGSNVSYSNAGGRMTNVWQGTCAGLRIRQVSTIDTGDSWMTTTVSLVNNTASTIPGVYFWRSVDSDGDPASPINYNTVNRIIYQNDVNHRALVVAEGVVYANARFGYGTVDSRAKVMIYDQWAPFPANIPGNSIDRVYNQTTTSLGPTWYNVGGTTPVQQDIAIGIAFNLGPIAPGDSAVFRYATIFGDTTDVDSIDAMHSITGPAAVCVGNTIALTDALSGGSWASSNTTIATVNNTGIVTGVSPGAVLISYTVSGSTTMHDVAVGAGVTSISGTLTICAGFSPTLTGTPAGGVWTSSNPGVATITTGGVYSGVSGGTAIISYSNGCSVSTRTVTINKRPTNISGATVDALGAKVYLCLGGTTVLSNDGYPLGAWTTGNTTLATVDATTGLLTSTGIAGTTTVTAFNLCGGAYVDLVATTPTAITGNLVICAPVTATILSNGAQAGVWSSGNTALATVEPVTGIVHAVPGGGSGSVLISYLFAGGCQRDTTIKISAAPTAITGPGALCVGNTLALSNAVAGGTWSSSSSSLATVDPITGVATGVSAGPVVIAYTTACGVITTTVSVGIAGYAGAGTATVCAGSNITLSNSIGGGVWTAGSTVAATVSGTGNVTGVSTGVTFITYTLSSCAMYITTLTVSPAQNVGIIEGPAVICVGSVVSLTDSVAGGVWSSSGAAVVAGDGEVTGMGEGNVVISYTITSACGVASAVKDILVLDPPEAGTITGPDHVCEGATIALSNEATGGAWSVTGGAATVSATGVVTGLAAGTAIISYTSISNVCGSSFTSYSITVVATPPAGVISGTSRVCVGAIIQLSETVTGGLWSSSNNAVASIVNSATGSVHALSDGVAIISYTQGTSGLCAATATFTLVVAPPPFSIVALVTSVSCFGYKNGSIDTRIEGGVLTYDFLWSTGAVLSSIADLDSGVYTLRVTEPVTQCIVDTSFTITQPAEIVIKDTTQADLCNGGTGSVLLDVSGGVGGYTYLWMHNENGHEIKNLHAGVYSVVVTDANNCTQRHVATVADSACGNITIHDVITPNADGFNDVWVIEGISRYTGSMVQIFDKWGDLLFERMNYQNDWSGMGKKGLLPDGTYYYLVKLNAPNAGGGGETFAGSLLIKR